ncbi:glycolipid 2-alpha-mannosyltransferase-domain-containing protein [Syncephalastrum racemosum]|uniref:Glycolipid 2-alpha-mannosyltransferase-domain-containing protein n=1 Tax=Syncephalastrum racemosum TaxID=13706 RepID=A0A1X2HE73_SYNRA|nr:glycolipid 2-alpha-mannosyltransferase-domain-containing protein [Syncephalastrum racemosum]
MRFSIPHILALLVVFLFYFGSIRYVSRTSSSSCSQIVENAQYLTAEEDVKANEVVLSLDDEKEGIQRDTAEDGSIGGIKPFPDITPPKEDRSPATDNKPEQEDPFPVCAMNRNSTVLEPKQSRNKTEKAKAAIVILVRNSELGAMRRTLREFEDRFNRRFNYPYVFLNDEPFTEVFQQSILQLTEAKVEFGLVPEQMWSVPSWVNETEMHERMNQLQSKGILYGGSLSYRHMCRFNSGFFYRHPLLQKYDYYWRVEPGVHFYCDLDYDPFLFMQKNNKMYSFTVALQEIPETIPTIWEHTLRFAHKNGLKTKLLRMFGDESGYNLCHFWSNFEIASLHLWRDKRYQAYFDYLDRTGNFFYERWGDAIAHSLATGLFLDKSQVHFFADIGYKHDNFVHCVDDGIMGKCMCPQNEGNFDYGWGSCLPNWEQYPAEGRRWDFKPNGDQVFDGNRVVKRLDLV